MRAARVTALDGPQSIGIGDEVMVPEPGPGEVLVEVRAAGVTFPEVLQSHGRYQSKPELPFTPGSEFSGIVAAVGDGTRARIGDRVVGLAKSGSFAEYALAKDANVLPLPESVPFVEGAAMPMNLLTADFALRIRAQAKPDDTVLVHGAGGGLGLATVQVAKHIGCRVIAVASSEEKRAAARDAGADEVIEVEGFLEAVRELTDGRGVDVVADPVGGDRFTDSLRSLSAGGRVAVLGFAAGNIPEVKVNRLLLNNVAVVGVGWGAMTLVDPALTLTQWHHLLPEIEKGGLRPTVQHVLPLDDVAAAVSMLESRAAVGKVVLSIFEGD